MSTLRFTALASGWGFALQIGTVLETGADLKFPRLCLPLDRSENAVNQIIKFKSISHT